MVRSRLSSLVRFAHSLQMAGALCLALALPSCFVERSHPQKAGPASPPQTRGLFADVAKSAGLGAWRHSSGPENRGQIVELTGGGCAFVDFDNDRWLDIVLLSCGDIERPSTAERPLIGLFRNNRDGSFADMTRGSGLDVPLRYGQGLAVGDFDNDGYADLFVVGYGERRLFRNRGAARKSGTVFEDVTARAGLGDATLSDFASGAAFGDFDSDGRLDLVVLRYIAWTPETDRKCPAPDGSLNYCGPDVYDGVAPILYRNEGSGRFRDVSRTSGLSRVPGRGLALAWLDYDADGRLDLYVANDRDPNRLFRNLGQGRFQELGNEVGASLAADGIAPSGMGIALGDYDHTGRESILVTNLNGEAFSLYKPERDGFEYATDRTGLRSLTSPFSGWGVAFLDADRDGWADLVAATGHVNPLIEKIGAPGVTYLQPMALLRNTGRGDFERWPFGLGDMTALNSRRGLAVGDYDRDGRLDVLCVNRNDRPSLYRNIGADSNHWVQLALRGTKSNRDGAGARVFLTANGQRRFAQCRLGSSYASSSDRRLYFGLGSAVRVDEVEVTWPNGRKDVVRNLSADRSYVLTEGGGCEPEP